MSRASELQKEVYIIVNRSRERCIGLLKERAINFKLHNAAEHGYGTFCGRGVVHGAGLSIYELIVLVNTGQPDDSYVIRKGNVMTIEQTIYYLPVYFGVRIDDMLNILLRTCSQSLLDNQGTDRTWLVNVYSSQARYRVYTANNRERTVLPEETW